MGKRRKKMGAEDEGGNVNANDIPADSREIVQSLQEVLSDFSKQEIHAMLVECDKNADEAYHRLRSQDPFQEVKSKRGKKKETKDKSDSCPQIQNPEFRDGDEHDVGQGGGNNFNSEKTSNVQETSNHLAGPSTTSGTLGPCISDLAKGETRSVPVSPVEALPSLSKSSSSDVTNGERKRVPISSVNAVPSLSVQPSREISAGQGTMAEVVKAAIALSEERVTKAPVKDVTNPVINISTQSASTRDQLGVSATVSNQNLRNDDYGGSSASVVTSLQQLSIENDTPEESVEEAGSSCLPSRFPDAESEKSADELSLRYLNTRGDESSDEDLNNERMAYQTEVNAARENGYTSSSSASDFTFDHSQRSNPRGPSDQMQSSSTFPDVMVRQRAHTREPGPRYSAFPFNQSMPREHSITTASSFGPRPSISMTEAYFCVPLNMVSSFYARPRQNITNHYQPPPFAFRQHCVLCNRLPPIQHQHQFNQNHFNQQSPSFRNRQQQQEQEQQLRRGFGYGRGGPYYDESLNQQNSRRDPSDQTQQRSWPRNNY